MTKEWKKGRRYKASKPYSLNLHGHSTYLNPTSPGFEIPEHYASEVPHLIDNGVLEVIGEPEVPEIEVPEVIDVAEPEPEPEVEDVVEEVKEDALPDEYGKSLFPCPNPECPAGRNMEPYKTDRALQNHLKKYPVCRPDE